MEIKLTKNSLEPRFLTTKMQRLLGWLVKVIRTETIPDQKQQLKLTDKMLWIDNLLRVLLWKNDSGFFLHAIDHFEWGNSPNFIRMINRLFVIISDNAGKPYLDKIIEANLYVREMTINNYVVWAIEKILLSIPPS